MPDRWHSLIDARYPAERSVLLRYHRAIPWMDPAIDVGLPDVEACSIAEGARVFPLARHRGVEILVCDESSLMATGTYKDLDACLIAAIARRRGLGPIVASSGGNLGYALAAYARRAGVPAFLFVPHRTLYKLDSASFGEGGVRLVSADLPERGIKSLARAFARRHGLAHVPEISWRFLASAVRALFLLERGGVAEGPPGRAQVIAQSLCAGYGPIGIYRCFAALAGAGMLAPARVPRLLGVQQEANAPMVRAFRTGERSLDRRHVQPRPDEYIEPGLYNVQPDESYALLFDVLRRHGGELTAVDAAAFEERRGMLLEWFRAAGCAFTEAPGRPGEILEKAGLITGVGILQAIDEGRVRPGERVIYLLTGGFRRPAVTAAPPAPDAEVDGALPEEAWVEELGRRFGLRALDAASPSSSAAPW